MKKLFVFALATALAGVSAMSLQSCDTQEPEESKSLVVTPLELTFPAAGDTKTVTVTGENWTAEPSDTWIAVENKADGTGFTVTVGATDEAKSGSIVVSNGYDSHTVTVAQSAPDVDASITVAPETLDFGFEAGEDVVTVTSELAWTATSNDSWITATKIDGTQLKIEVKANTEAGAEARNGSITIDNGENMKTVTVTQDAPPAIDPSIEIDPMNLTFTFEAGEDVVTVTSELAWTATSNDSWITATKIDGTQLKIEVKANTEAGAEARNGSVTVSNGTETETLAIEQGVDTGVQMTHAKGAYTSKLKPVKENYLELHFTTYEGSSLTSDPNDPSDNGHHLYFKIYTTISDKNIPEGTYTHGDAKDPFTIYDSGYGDSWCQWIVNGAFDSDLGVAAGSTMTVSGNGNDGYSINLNVVHSDGTILKAYYNGVITL